MDEEEFQESVRDFVDLHANKYEEAKEEPIDRDRATKIAINHIHFYTSLDDIDLVSEYSDTLSGNVEERVAKEVALRITTGEDEFIEKVAEAEFEKTFGGELSTEAQKILEKVFEIVSDLPQNDLDGLYLWYLNEFPHDELSSLERNYTRAFESSDELADTITESVSEGAKNGLDVYSRYLDVIDTGLPLLLAIKRADNGNLDQTANLVSMNFGAIVNEIEEGRFSSVLDLASREIRNGIKHGDSRVIPAKREIRVNNNRNMSYSEFKSELFKVHVFSEILYRLPAVIGYCGRKQTEIDASVDF